MKTTYTETRHLYWDDLRHLCIKQNWFTRGSTEDYNTLHEYVRNSKFTNVTTELIIFYADFIKSFSDTEQDIESIAFEIARICFSTFEMD